MPVLVMFEIRDEVFSGSEALENFIATNPFISLCEKWRYQVGEEAVIPDDYTREVRLIYKPKERKKPMPPKKTAKKVAATKRTGK